MAVRRPLIVSAGQVKELPAGDSIPPIVGLCEVKVAMAANNIDVATGNLFYKVRSAAPPP